MVHSREALKIIANTLRDSPKFPEEMSYILREPDPDGQDSAVSIPVTVLKDINIDRDDPSNSTFVDYLENSSGERVGKVYETKWEMIIEIDIWTAAGSEYNVDEIGEQLHEVLFAYDSRGPAKTFRDDSGEARELIYDFSLQDSERNDSLDQSPSVRRWRQRARVRGAEQLTTTSDDVPVRNVTQ